MILKSANIIIQWIKSNIQKDLSNIEVEKNTWKCLTKFLLCNLTKEVKQKPKTKEIKKVIDLQQGFECTEYLYKLKRRKY